MLVPRSFKYSSSPPLRDSTRVYHPPKKSHNIPAQPLRSDIASTRSNSPPMTLTSAMPAPPQPSKPVEIPSQRSSGESKNPRSGRSRPRKSRHVEQQHRPDALPPAVAALLAVTAIPRPRSQPRRKKGPVRDMSIDELVQEWRSDSIKSSYSSASLDMLLGSADEDDYEHMYSSRSTSCDSIPSLEADETSLLSVSNPATPNSVRSRKSSTASYRKEKSFCTPETEDCGYDHPLGLPTLDLDDDLILAASPSPKERRQRKSSSFRSNLTSSLQAIKSRVSSSFSSLNLNLDDDSFSDASLWQHPYLFPRLSSELRPTPFASTPSRSQRRYFNPQPASVSFEEQQHHWQRALSSTCCVTFDEQAAEAPMIQMQTYKRGTSSPSRRSRRSSSSGPDPRSEAGRAMSGHVPMPSRQREPRENSDFLRVVVLEMNMRRGGKLEESSAGRARIWLPPRKQVVVRDSVFADDEGEEDVVGASAARKIPRRWVGVSIE